MIKRLKIRQIIEEREESLSPCAVRSRLSKGRVRLEEPCPVRTAFQHDRDRIIHCKAFRRLKHKTQVFIAPLGDHYVTRLTHTLEVSQIARTISRALNLNEDLTEAISLGHDLGHTPFGHVGEDVLDELFLSGFRHNEQSLRVVDILENEGKGLNLTWEVRDGILNHSKSRAEVLGEGWGVVGTLEGEVCKIADIIAYINHDIDDAIRAGMLAESDLPGDAVAVLGTSHSRRINTMVCDVIKHSWAVRTAEAEEPPVIGMSRRILRATNVLRDFLFEKVYNLLAGQEESEKAREVVRNLYQYLVRHPEKLPVEYSLGSGSTERRVVDYIAGMTDQYALRMAKELIMVVTENELWQRIKALEGKTVYTITRQVLNKITEVNEDSVYIAGKSPVGFKGETGIFENYHRLIKDGFLVGESYEEEIRKANLYGRYVIMTILHHALPDETKRVKGGIRIS